MAVDSEKAPSNHRYSATEYQRQFQLRRNAAIAHITQAYGKWKAAHA